MSRVKFSFAHQISSILLITVPDRDAHNLTLNELPKSLLFGNRGVERWSLVRGGDALSWHADLSRTSQLSTARTSHQHTPDSSQSTECGIIKFFFGNYATVINVKMNYNENPPECIFFIFQNICIHVYYDWENRKDHFVL